MTSEEEKTIRLLETRTRQLILKFTQLKEDNEELLGQINEALAKLQADGPIDSIVSKYIPTED